MQTFAAQSPNRSLLPSFANTTTSMPITLLRLQVNVKNIDFVELQAFLEDGIVPSSDEVRSQILTWSALHNEPDVFIRLLIDSGKTEVNLSRKLEISLSAAQCIAGVLKTNAPVTSLSLEGSIFSAPESILIFEALKSNRTVVNLSIRSNYFADIGEGGAQVLGDIFSTNQSLKKIDLTHCSLDTTAALAIAAGLKRNATLDTLYLGINEFSNEGVHAIAAALKDNQSLSRLSLSHLKLDGGGIKPLATLLETNSTLTELLLEGNLQNPFYREITAALHRNKLILRDLPHLLGAGQAFSAQLVTPLPTEIGQKLARQLLHEPAQGLRDLRALAVLNKTCHERATHAERNRQHAQVEGFVRNKF